MIQTNELRVGNFVELKVNDYSSIVKVTKTGMERVSLLQCSIAPDGIEADYNLIEPIPLTPEILLNADCSDFGNDEYYSNFEPNWIMRNDDDGFTLVICGKDFRKVKYLHEYQNLYFALTGTELEIKELNGNLQNNIERN